MAEPANFLALLAQNPYGQGNADPNLLERASQEYPMLRDLGIQYKFAPAPDRGYLEFWAQGEPGTREQPRPKDLSLDKPGLEVFNRRTRPIDILGDVASHYLKDRDPTIAGHYRKFEKSLSPQQFSLLRDQYEYAKANEGEKRVFNDWLQMTGLPAYFRGYAFRQWPQEFNERAYRPEQMQQFDQMMNYLEKARGNGQ